MRTKTFAFDSKVLLGLLVAAGACKGSATKVIVDMTPPVPPRMCKAAATAGASWFTDATADYGLTASAALPVTAGVVVGADMDGDGWVDLFTATNAGDRGTTPRTSFFFFNRPSPSDPTKRVFVESTEAAGFAATRDGAGGRNWGNINLGDLDNDGSVDAILCPSWIGASGDPPVDSCEAYLNDGKGNFKLAPASDLDATSWVTPGATLLDYDQDGILDFWPATVASWPYGGVPDQYATLYKGNGDGTFKDVSKAVGLPQVLGDVTDDTARRPFFGSTACDIDGEGDDDMILATYGREENWVFRNDGGKFTEVGQMLGIAHDDRESYQDDQSYECYCQANPGLADCMPAPPTPSVNCCTFCTQQGATCPGQCPPLFRGWSKASEKSYNLGGNNFSIACGDIDDDGDMDLMTATIVHGDVGSASDPSELVINPGDGTKFTRPGNVKTGLDRPASGVYWNHGDDMAVMADLDLDGKKDIFVTTTGAYPDNDHAWLWQQQSDGTFKEISAAAGFSSKVNYHGPGFLDIDGDGDLDVVIGDTTKTQSMHVFRNTVGQDQNWLRIKLAGKGKGGSNANGIGARVRVTANGHTQTQEVQGGFGHGSVENDVVLTFGLGSTCDVDKVEVMWPNATHDRATFTGVLANYNVTLHEGDTHVYYVEPTSGLSGADMK